MIRTCFGLSGLVLFLVACRAPLFRSEADRFAPAPEVIEQVEPYVEAWASMPAGQTLEQRLDVAAQINGIWTISVTSEVSDLGQTVQVVDIPLEVFGDWFRGYLYVPAGVTLQETPLLKLRRVDEHWYIYNRWV